MTVAADPLAVRRRIQRYLPRWRAVALVAAGLAVGWLFGAASHQHTPTPATLAPGPTAARYQVATQAGYGWACLIEWDATTGQVWLYDRENGRWTELPALPALPAERNTP